MEKSLPIDSRPPSNSENSKDEGVQVSVEANRCPFCRDDVAPTESVVCQSCLTRHHPDCWDEAGQCSSCSSQIRLQAGQVSSPRVITDADITRILEKEGYRSEEIMAYLSQRDEAEESCGWDGCSRAAKASSVLGSTSLCLIHARRSARLGQLFFLALTFLSIVATIAVAYFGSHKPTTGIGILFGFVVVVVSLLMANSAGKRFNTLRLENFAFRDSAS